MYERHRSRYQLNIINFLARAVGVGFCLTGANFIIGWFIVQDAAINPIVGILLLIVGVLFLRVRKVTLQDLQKYFGRRR